MKEREKRWKKVGKEGLADRRKQRVERGKRANIFSVFVISCYLAIGCSRTVLPDYFPSKVRLNKIRKNNTAKNRKKE
jgi:hypothetical protein